MTDEQHDGGHEDEEELLEGRDFVFYRSGRTAEPTLKEKAWLELAAGRTLTSIQDELGINRGTLSKWRRSPAFAKWLADHGGQPYKPMVKKGRPGPKRKKRNKAMVNEMRGRFMQAVSVGGLAFAQQFAGCNDHDTAIFLRELAVSEAHAKPRVKVLAELLNLGLDRQNIPTVRVKALETWWKLAENTVEQQGPLIHIDARQGGTDAPPTPAQMLMASIKDRLADVMHADLMDGVDLDAIIDQEDPPDDSPAEQSK